MRFAMRRRCGEFVADDPPKQEGMERHESASLSLARQVNA